VTRQSIIFKKMDARIKSAHDDTMDARINRAFKPVFDGLCPRMTMMIPSKAKL